MCLRGMVWSIHRYGISSFTFWFYPAYSGQGTGYVYSTYIETRFALNVLIDDCVAKNYVASTYIVRTDGRYVREQHSTLPSSVQLLVLAVLHQ